MYPLHLVRLLYFRGLCGRDALLGRGLGLLGISLGRLGAILII